MLDVSICRCFISHGAWLLSMAKKWSRMKMEVNLFSFIFFFFIAHVKILQNFFKQILSSPRSSFRLIACYQVIKWFFFSFKKTILWPYMTDKNINWNFISFYAHSKKKQNQKSNQKSNVFYCGFPRSINIKKHHKTRRSRST